MDARNEKLIDYYLETGYYLGCQLAFDADCFMFINFREKDTDRGNIEIFEDGTIRWFYTTNTNTDKEQYIDDLKKTPEWFRRIYYETLNIKQNKKTVRTA